MSDPRSTLVALVAAEKSQSSASIEEIDGNLYFHNPEAASTALALVNAARRGKRIKISSTEENKSKTTLGVTVEEFTIGFSHMASSTRRQSLEIEYYEQTVSDQIIEIMKVAPHWKPDVVLNAISVANKMIETGKVGSIDPVAAKNTKSLVVEDAEFMAP